MICNAAVSNNARRRRSNSKRPRKPKNLENKENDAAKNGQRVKDPSLKCSQCHRKFQKESYLNYHSVMCNHVYEKRNKMNRSCFGGAQIRSPEKLRAEAGISKRDSTTKKRRCLKRRFDQFETERLAAFKRAPLFGVSNAESLSAASLGHDVHRPKIPASAEENRESEPVASASAAQHVDAEDISWSKWSPKEAGVESCSEHITVQAAAEYQPKSVEQPLEKNIEDALATPNWRHNCFCEVQLGVQCSMRSVKELSPITFPLINSRDLFFEGTSLHLDGIELAERLTTRKEDYLKTLGLITRCREGMGVVEHQPAFDGNDSLLDHCEDVVPDDFYVVLMSAALDQQTYVSY